MRSKWPLMMILPLVAAPLMAAEPGARSTSAESKEKLICKRFVRTGSLVDGYRSCKSKKEWDREHENLQQIQVTDSCRTRGSGMGCD